MPRLGIYVELLIHTSMDEVWRLTQTPTLHRRWDLRFTTIEYLPRLSKQEPQRFLYKTRLAPGLTIRGTGETAGQRHTPEGHATSALRFGSAQPWSLIREGSGYWSYIPVAGAIRFLTWYDYETRFGALGRAINAILLRPLMGWATAWSFDRLRLWIEEAQVPEVSLLLAAVYAIARTTVAAVWLWHGLVPKLLFHDAGEQTMLLQAGLSPSLVNVFGAAEVLFGMLLLVFWRARWMLVVTIAAMIAALIETILRSPQFVTAAFNPVTLNLCVMALALAAYLVQPRVPSAARCLRRKPAETP